MLFLLSNKIRFISLITVILVLVSSVSCGTNDPVSEGPAMLMTPGTSYTQNTQKVVEVKLGTITKNASGEGGLYFPKTRHVTTTFHNARLLSVNVKKGDEVREGDVIAEFEIEYNKSDLKKLTNDYDIANLQYKASLEGVKASVEAAKNRLDTLKLQPDTPASELAKSEILYKKAQSSYEFFIYEQKNYLSNLKDALENFKSVISYNTIYAPIDGVVGSVDYLIVGNIIDPNTSICTLYSIDPLWLTTTVDVSYGMRYNTDVDIKVTGYDEPLPGRIVTAPDIFDATTGRVTIMPLVEDLNISPDDRMRRITIVAERYTLSNVMVLPSSAVQNEEGKRYVYIVEDGVLKKRYVSVGLSSLSDVQILDGLEVGQIVALT